MRRRHYIWLLCAILMVTLAVFGCQQALQTPAPTPTPNIPPLTTANYVGSDTCKTCHKDTHTGFIKTEHFSAFKPLSDYNISDLPKQITVFDADNKENPKSTTIDTSTVVGVMVDDYVIAPVPATAGFTNKTYRVAAVHKSGDKWTLEPASKKDFNNDGKEDWGASNYSCGKCHSPGLGVSTIEATISCESCHGPGGNHVNADEKAGTMKVSQEACLACHTSNPAKNKEGVWETTNHYGTRDYFSSKHANSKQTNNCLACHDPHNTNKDGKTVIGDDPVKDNCVKCHAGKNINLDTLMWKNPTDPYNHITRDHSFGAMPYDKLGDKKDTKPVEITNADMIKIITDKLKD